MKTTAVAYANKKKTKPKAALQKGAILFQS